MRTKRRSIKRSRSRSIKRSRSRSIKRSRSRSYKTKKDSKKDVINNLNKWLKTDYIGDVRFNKNETKAYIYEFGGNKKPGWG
jgi:hypothetical protein